MISKSMVAAYVNIDIVPSGFIKMFSGECDGQVTSFPATGVPAGASTRKSRMKRAAPCIKGHALRRRKSRSPVN